MPVVHALTDLCLLLSPPAASTDGEPVQDGTWTTSASSVVACLVVRSLNAREAADGSQARVTDTQVIVTRGTTVNNTQRVRVTKYKDTVVSVDYLILGEPFIPSWGDMVLSCQRVEGGSAG